MPISSKALRSLVPAIGLGVVLALPAGAQEASHFTTDAWRHAADPRSQQWSREVLLDRFLAETKLDNLDRQRLLALLGQPGYARESYAPGQGLVGRLDIYRLSAKNNRSFHVSYRPSGQFEGSLVDPNPCVCPLCKELPPGTDSTLQDAVVTDLLTVSLAQDPFVSTRIPELEQLVGHPGKRSSVSERTIGQAWVSYNVAWRVAGGGGDHFLSASGRVPGRDWQSFDDARLEAYDLITMEAECLAP
ncbi:MAG TPA: hypothetical protein VM689_20630 [Aliidongia sp.]|nr:hypothetical protein [Aliidongia sp.]